MCGSRWWNGTERRSRWRSTAVRQNCAERRSARQRTGWVRCCSISPTPMMWIKPGPQAAPERNWTRWWNPLCRPSGRQDSGRRRMRRAISSTGRKQDPEKRTFRVWYLIANPRGLPKEVCPERAGVSVETVPRKEGGNQMSNKAFQQNLNDKKRPPARWPLSHSDAVQRAGRNAG